METKPELPRIPLEILDPICERDKATADTWFTGPKSFTAQAARDRRELLGLVKVLIDHLDALGEKLHGYS